MNLNVKNFSIADWLRILGTVVATGAVGYSQGGVIGAAIAASSALVGALQPQPGVAPVPVPAPAPTPKP